MESRVDSGAQHDPSDGRIMQMLTGSGAVTLWRSAVAIGIAMGVMYQRDTTGQLSELKELTAKVQAVQIEVVKLAGKIEASTALTLAHDRRLDKLEDDTRRRAQ